MCVRCLIVDDNDGFLQAARARLNREGIEVVGVASTSAEAVARVGELRPDVVLIDIRLGAECGFDLARQLAGTRSTERSEVIMISSYAQADYADMLVASPCLGYIPKLGLSGNAVRALLKNVISVLTRDHRRIVDLLVRLPMTHGTPRRRLADELTSEIIRHAVADDRYLYPALSAVVPASAVDAARETGTHTRIEGLLADLAQAPPDSLTFDELVTKLVSEVDRETLHEEVDVFPWLARYGDPQMLIHLGEQIQAFKDTAVVEKTPAGGLAIRCSDRMLHRWEPPPRPDAPS
jgi:DNA-binding NarL/FixJ family response regulator